ncbi:uncharacterized protein F4822DRAFT_13642 [Hypoxylon trugodes]|uniref:uncharacterized protein n=1 Tax=Hypoxylon trugodes TaxID=326681 RepID=UPI002199CC52|nr:uncharacterized protein F4822DRAFT_13642 [Hypoxylon trugodes]KAI1393456.1 hypothetical protein F4822DRAFT_13642 [Hypoxylon trugodes]
MRVVLCVCICPGAVSLRYALCLCPALPACLGYLPIYHLLLLTALVTVHCYYSIIIVIIAKVKLVLFSLNCFTFQLHPSNLCHSIQFCQSAILQIISLHRIFIRNPDHGHYLRHSLFICDILANIPTFHSIPFF